MTQELLPPLSVLVVEDQEDIALSAAELLTLHGHAVRVARSGPEALAAVAAAVPDVVLLDIGLPGMSGWEVARRLRAGVDGKQPVVVAVTGYGAPADRVNSADAGIDLHLTKPADPEKLAALLARIRAALAARAAEPSA